MNLFSLLIRILLVLGLSKYVLPPTEWLPPGREASRLAAEHSVLESLMNPEQRGSEVRKLLRLNSTSVISNVTYDN